MAYLLDSEVHTFAFSVAANAIISFIPFVVLLYTLALSVFHSDAMKGVVDDMVNYFLPSATKQPDWLTNTIVSEAVLPLLKHHGAQAFSLVMILIACTGIFLPLEVALNQAWGVKRSRNYLFNQTIAVGLALLMLGLGVASMVVNVNVDKVLAIALVHDSDNWFFTVPELLLQRPELPLADGLNGRRVDFVLLLGLLRSAQSQGALAASVSNFCHYRNCLADFEVHLRYGAAASGFRVALRAVLRFGRLAFLGIHLRSDFVCRRAVQRGAVGRREEVERPAWRTSVSKTEAGSLWI